MGVFGSLYINRVSNNQVTNNKTIAVGTPIIIQSKKLILKPYISSKYKATKAFGAVPIRVERPPMLAAYAIESTKGVFKVLKSDLLLIFITDKTDKPIGNIIIVVAVFVTHIDKKALEIINPANKFL